MHYLVDGNNLIGHERGLSLADPASRDVVVRGACALSRRLRKRITIVFDGPAPGPGSGRVALGDVKVLYAGAGRSAMSADERILQMVGQAGRAGDLTVVTSDHPLGGRARSLGAQVLPCHKFRALLQDAARAEAAGPEKPTHVDVRDWAAWFGIEEPD